MIDYLDSFQTFAVIYAIMAFGFICGVLKLFSTESIQGVRHYMDLIALPALLFHVVGNRPLTSETFLPLLISVLTVLSIQLALILISILSHSPLKFLVFLEYSLAATQPNFIYMGYPILHILFGDSFLYVPVVSSLVHAIFVHPLHAVIAGYFIERDREPVAVVSDLAGVRKISRPSSVDEMGNPILEEIEQTEIDAEAEMEVDEQGPVREPLWRLVLFAFVTPANIGFALGLLWALTPWKMFTFISVFVVDLEKSVVASGLFCAGTYIWEHPFLNGDPVRVSLSVVSHAAVLPAIALLWCWLFGVGDETATGLVLGHATSMSFRSVVDAERFGLREKTPTYSFVWSSFLSLPVLMLWVVVLKATHLFGN
jgi:predicted permease